MNIACATFDSTTWLHAQEKEPTPVRKDPTGLPGRLTGLVKLEVPQSAAVGIDDARLALRCERQAIVTRSANTRSDGSWSWIAKADGECSRHACRAQVPAASQNSLLGRDILRCVLWHRNNFRDFSVPLAINDLAKSTSIGPWIRPRVRRVRMASSGPGSVLRNALTRLSLMSLRSYTWAAGMSRR
jgi:hypothetical protein